MISCLRQREADEPASGGDAAVVADEVTVGVRFVGFFGRVLRRRTLRFGFVETLESIFT
jgi:hypothetical protein